MKPFKNYINIYFNLLNHYKNSLKIIFNIINK